MVDAQQFSGAVSRRRALLTGAGLVAAGVVAGATGGVAATQFAASGSFAALAQEDQLPVMVHLLDASTGQLDVFFGDNKVTIEDAAFVAKLVELTTTPPASSPAR